MATVLQDNLLQANYNHQGEHITLLLNIKKKVKNKEDDFVASAFPQKDI